MAAREVPNFERTCRACKFVEDVLDHPEDTVLQPLTEVPSNQPEMQPIIEMWQEMFSTFKAFPDDKLPQLMCTPCLEDMLKCFKFFAMCKNSHKDFYRSMFGDEYVFELTSGGAQNVDNAMPPALAAANVKKGAADVFYPAQQNMINSFIDAAAVAAKQDQIDGELIIPEPQKLIADDEIKEEEEEEEEEQVVVETVIETAEDAEEAEETEVAQCVVESVENEQQKLEDVDLLANETAKITPMQEDISKTASATQKETATVDTTTAKMLQDNALCEDEVCFERNEGKRNVFVNWQNDTNEVQEYEYANVIVNEQEQEIASNNLDEQDALESDNEEATAAEQSDDEEDHDDDKLQVIEEESAELQEEQPEQLPNKNEAKQIDTKEEEVTITQDDAEEDVDTNVDVGSENEFIEIIEPNKQQFRDVYSSDEDDENVNQNTAGVQPTNAVEQQQQEIAAEPCKFLENPTYEITVFNDDALRYDHEEVIQEFHIEPVVETTIAIAAIADVEEQQTQPLQQHSQASQFEQHFENFALTAPTLMTNGDSDLHIQFQADEDGNSFCNGQRTNNQHVRQFRATSIRNTVKRTLETEVLSTSLRSREAMMANNNIIHNEQQHNIPKKRARYKEPQDDVDENYTLSVTTEVDYNFAENSSLTTTKTYQLCESSNQQLTTALSHSEQIDVLTCCICLQSCESIALLQQHQAAYHPNEFAEMLEQTDVALETVAKATRAATKQRTGRTPKFIACQYCPGKFKSIHMLGKHVLKDHADETAAVRSKVIKNQVTSDDPDRPYVCQDCLKTFSQLGALKDHLRTHTKEQPHLCTECGKAFSSASNMKQHLMRHTGELRYECDQCPKKFPCQSDLASHKVVHTQYKPHKCDQCDAAFGKPYQLKKHRMYHTNDKPHKCDYCEMRFVCADHMRRHMRTHTGEKPYECYYCDRAFAQSNDLVKHTRTHVGVNVYHCEFCPQSFRLASEKRAHLPEHKNDDEETKRRNQEAMKALREKQQLLHKFQRGEGSAKHKNYVKRSEQFSEQVDPKLIEEEVLEEEFLNSTILPVMIQSKQRKSQRNGQN